MDRIHLDIIDTNITYNDNVVLCDLDGTLLKTSLIVELLNFFVEKGNIISVEDMEYFIDIKNDYEKRNIFYKEYSEMVFTEFCNIIKGIEYEALDNIFDQMVEEYHKKIHFSILRYLTELSEKGFKIVLLSNAPQELLDYFVRKYNFNFGLGTILETTEIIDSDDEVEIYTGNVQNINKSEIVDILSDKKCKIVSFGDGLEDLDMLKKSYFGYVINPGSKLYNEVKNIPNILICIEKKDISFVLDKNVRDYIDVSFY